MCGQQVNVLTGTCRREARDLACSEVLTAMAAEPRRLPRLRRKG
jgi:hypothetical protein